MPPRPPRCSIIIPTHDCAEYLSAALSSIVVQGIDDLEILVVDDASTDDTPALLAAWGGAIEGLRVLRTERLGPAGARNHALAEARAPLIAFLDADDVWLAGKLAPQLALHEARPEVVMSFTDYRHVGPDGEDRGGCFAFWNRPAPSEAFSVLPDPWSTLLGCNLVGTSTVVARRDALVAVEGFDRGMPSSEDWDLWLKLARRGPVAWSGRVGCDYLMRPGSVTAARERRIRAMEITLARALREHRRPKRRDVRLAKARLATARAECARERDRTLEAVIGHAHALALAPSRRALGALLHDIGRLAPPMINRRAIRSF